MKIECTPQELKELIEKETPVAGTTDVKHSYNSNYISGTVCLEEAK